MAVETKCQTPGARFQIRIRPGGIDVYVGLPFDLTLDEAGARLLEDNLHNAVEIVLARYFTEAT